MADGSIPEMDDSERLRNGVREAYSAVSRTPGGEHPFQVGRRFAEGLGYPSEVLENIPTVTVEAFTGVSNVSLFSELPLGASVLDLGCGAGLDALLAGERVGSGGSVIGVDFSLAMVSRARQGANEAQLSHVHFCQGNAEELPLRSQSMDAAMVNGIFNLNPARNAIFRELARVVKPGGSVYAAELILRNRLAAPEKPSLDDWFA
jgi:SAM-dependent methyltransferase